MLPSGQRLPDTSSGSLDRELIRERTRYFEANRWIGPIGLTAAALLYYVLVSRLPTPPDLLEPWLVLVLASAVVQVVGFLHPRLVSIVDRNGVPITSIVTQALFGIGWGATLWLDAESVQDAEFRWTTLAAMFAISGGASAGLSGVNSLGRWLIVPMWVLSGISLLLNDHPIAALAVAVYLAINVRDMRDNGILWAELIGRRVQATRDAEASATAAARDPLTGLLNRSGLMNHLSQRSSDQGADSETVTILFIDLDHFKSVNDRYGHRTGDLVLIEVAERLRRSLRSEDAIARIGGDEFCALLGPVDADAGTGGRSGVVVMAERIVAELAAPIRTTTGDEVAISASVGIAEMGTIDTDVERLLMDADHAMYQAKRRGRNQVVYFDDELHRDLVQRSRLAAGLRQAIMEQRLATSVRPVRAMDSDEVLCIDLAPGWQDTAASTMSAEAILALAIESGLVADLTSLMLRAAAELQSQWREHPTLADVRISVAVSTKSVLRSQVHERVDDAIARNDLDPARLSLRLTDIGVPVAGRPDLLAPFHELVGRGITLEVEDIGRGDGSIGDLLALPISTVRLDQSITGAIGSSPRHTAIVKSIVDLCRSLDQSVLADQTSDPSQIETLRQIGVTGLRLRHDEPAASQQSPSLPSQ